MTFIVTPYTKVPVDPLIGDVSLLLHGDGTNGAQNNTFLDSSTNNFTITRNGNTTQGSFSPFGKVGGSAYFDGTTDRLTVASNITLPADCTVELWFYGPAQNAKTMLFGNTVTMQTSNLGQLLIYDGTDRVVGSYVPNQWTHFAFTRQGTTIRAFIDGVQGATWTQSSTNVFDFSTRCLVGGRSDVGGFDWNGYISNLRILKGTALYTSNFTPPTAPLTAITNTSLLLNFTNAGIVDSAAKNNLETVGNAQVSTAQSKFGGGSIAFDGNGAYLTAPDSQNLELGGGDFTIECWFYLNALPSNLAGSALVTKWNANNYSFLAAAYNNSGTMQLFFGYSTNGTSTTNLTANASISTGAWFHCAFVRSGNSFRMFLNGSEVTSSATITGTLFNGTEPVAIGRTGDNFNYLNGYIDDLRITKYARYTANFTPPTAAFPDI